MSSKSINMKGIKMSGVPRTKDGQKINGQCTKERILRLDGQAHGAYKSNRDIQGRRNATKAKKNKNT